MRDAPIGQARPVERWLEGPPTRQALVGIGRASTPLMAPNTNGPDIRTIPLATTPADGEAAEIIIWSLTGIALALSVGVTFAERRVFGAGATLALMGCCGITLYLVGAARRWLQTRAKTPPTRHDRIYR